MSRQTVQRMGEEVSDEVLVVLGDIEPRVNPKDISDLELLKIIRNRSKVSDWDLCQERGWRVWEFNQMIADLVKKYPSTLDDFWRSA